jgi:hypothetical protein
MVPKALVQFVLAKMDFCVDNVHSAGVSVDGNAG